MDSQQFDAITSTFAQTQTRRRALRLLGAALVGAGSFSLLQAESSQARRRKKKRHGQPDDGAGTAGGPKKDLGEICDPDVDVCQGNLQCGAPTTRHTCSSTVEGIDHWCCVPPGGRCSECDCCGNYYCSYDDNNIPTCVPNPEG